MAICATTTDFPGDALREAQAISVCNASFSDTAYYLFSRRSIVGRVGMPRAVYASSLVMKAASNYFCAQLEGGFRIQDRIAEDTEDYSYDDDSDIDEDENWSDLVDALSDDIGSRDSCSSSMLSPDKGKGKANVTDEEGSFAVQAAADAARGVKRRVFVPDIAATTWSALVHFLYTGKVYFAPLKSQGIELRQEVQSQHEAKFPNGPPLCSPKSMYRLADIVGLNSLRCLAESAIKASLCEKCIADEIFSRFSSIYPDILDAQLRFIYRDGVFTRVFERIEHRVRSVVLGTSPHSEMVLSLLLGKLSEFLVFHKAPPLPRTPWDDALERIPVEGAQPGHDQTHTTTALTERTGEERYSQMNGAAGVPLRTTGSSGIIPIAPTPQVREGALANFAASKAGLTPEEFPGPASLSPAQPSTLDPPAPAPMLSQSMPSREQGDGTDKPDIVKSDFERWRSSLRMRNSKRQTGK